MSASTQFNLFLNPVAGKGRALKAYHQLVPLLEQKGIAFKTIVSREPGEFIDLAKRYGDQSHHAREFLIVIGGDGSLNQVLNGIKRSARPDTPFTYLPAGTGDDFARAAGVTTDMHQLVKDLTKPPVIERIDCGSYTEAGDPQKHYFVNNLGIGFDGNLVHHSNAQTLKERLNKVHLGYLIYLINGFDVLSHQDTFDVVAKSKDKTLHFADAYFATTTNHPYFGGGIKIMPKASLYSHKLDTVIVEKHTIAKFLYLFGKVFTNGSQVNDRDFHYLEAKEIWVRTHQPELAQLDGEDLPDKSYDLHFKVDHFYLLR